jgi:hypothetical protein
MPTKKFPLDSVLGAGAGASLDLSGTTNMDVVRAVTGGTPMPTRPEGVLELGSIALTVATGSDLRFKAGAAKVDVSFSAGVSAGLGIYDAPAGALAALDLEETPGLDIRIDDPQATRFALLRSGYSASGGAKGTHPIGAIGSFSFGASARAAGVTAVLQAFHDDQRAADVIRDVVAAWKLPRHVTAAAALPPRTWVIAEAEGSLAVNLAAQVGYDFTFVRELQAGGLSGDVGLKIDAAARATFGFDVSGRYLVVVGRDSDAERVRVRMFKLARRGVEFGLNLKVGVTGIESVSTGRVDNLIKAAFGVHGTQVVTALARLDEWTGKEQPVGTLVAGLINDRALTLIRDATGIDPETAFEAARARLTGAIQLWQKLPERVASELLGILDGLDAPAVSAFRDSVTLLASEDEGRQKEALASLLDTAGFEGRPAGRLLMALADRGLLDLLDRLPDVRRTAGLVADILDGDVIRRLQGALTKALNLDRLIDPLTKADFDELDSFLVGRLGAFLDRELHFEQVEEIRQTIHVLLAKRQEIFEKARKALTTRYGAEIAGLWRHTTSKTAVLDVEIDTSDATGAALLEALLADGDLDRLLTSASRAVTFHSALLTHEARRSSTLPVTLPRTSFRIEHANQSLAGVSVVEDGGRVLLYHMTASDVVTDTRRRYRSSLSIGLSSAVAIGGGPDLRVHGASPGSWSYQLVHAAPRMRRGELEMYTRPFLDTFMHDRFGRSEQWSTWFTELDQTVEGLLGNGPNEFGDVLLAMETSIPADALTAWLRPQRDVLAASKAVSLSIQRALKTIVPFYFFQDSGTLFQQASSAALFVWAALPPTTFARLDGSRLIREGGKSSYWDHHDQDLRNALSHHPIVSATLAERFVAIRERLQERGLGERTGFFTASEVPDWIHLATSETGDRFLLHLCQFEALVVDKAVDALEHMQAFLSMQQKQPSKAIDRLAEFGADITTAFNKLSTDTVFARAPLNTLTQGVFLDASRALSPSLGASARGMLTLTVLKPADRRAFKLEDFLAGKTPSQEDVALEQRLVSA